MESRLTRALKAMFWLKNTNVSSKIPAAAVKSGAVAVSNPDDGVRDRVGGVQNRDGAVQDRKLSAWSLKLSPLLSNTDVNLKSADYLISDSWRYIYRAGGRIRL